MALSVLIIDADDPSVKLARVVLEVEGWQVIHAPTNAHARELLVSARPDLVVTALGVPEEPALDLVRELKMLAREVPIVAVTALDGAESRARAAGCAGFIQKPISIDAFAAQLHSYLGGKR
jgi:two-component system, cell cycle response regulator DivK